MVAEKVFRNPDIIVRELIGVDVRTLFVFPRLLEIDAVERAGYGYFTLRSAAHRADVTVHAGAETARTPYLADGASHLLSIGDMPLTNLFLKVEIEHDEHEPPERIGEEICRYVLKFYSVRSAEISSFTRSEE
jgi:hypothetical protein